MSLLILSLFRHLTQYLVLDHNLSRWIRFWDVWKKIVKFCCEIKHFSILINCSKMLVKVQFWSRPHSTPKLVFTYMFYLENIFFICKIQRGGRMRPWPNFDLYCARFTYLNPTYFNDFVQKHPATRYRISILTYFSFKIY